MNHCKGTCYIYVFLLFDSFCWVRRLLEVGVRVIAFGAGSKVFILWRVNVIIDSQHFLTPWRREEFDFPTWYLSAVSFTGFISSSKYACTVCPPDYQCVVLQISSKQKQDIPFGMQYNHKANFAFSSILSRVAPEHNKYITENLDDYGFLF